MDVDLQGIISRYAGMRYEGDIYPLERTSFQ